MKIGIYGGSFDPIHKGHTKIAEIAINELSLDKLLFVPAYISPFKTGKNIVSAEHRINMINLVKPDKTEVCEFEIKRNNLSYTIDTIKYLKNKYKDDELFLIIGSDNINLLHKWKDIDEIASLVKICVFKRTRNVNKTNIKKYNCLLLKNPIYDYSSTEFKKGFLDVVDEKVIDYIGENKLYSKELVHNMLSAKRAKHSVAAAEFAASLAKSCGYDAKKAYFAGLFHDIAKEWEPENSLGFIKSILGNSADFSKHELHQVAGSLWVKHIYKINDEDITHAIRVHTTMNENGISELNTLDKILYISDKICMGRKFPGIQKLREVVHQDLDKGFALVVKRTYLFEKEKGTKFSDWQEQIYLNYIKEVEKYEA